MLAAMMSATDEPVNTADEAVVEEGSMAQSRTPSRQSSAGHLQVCGAPEL